MNKGITAVEFIVGLSIVFLVFAIIFGGLFFNWNTNSGTHTGYVTAVDQSGVFVRNYTIYFKTNLQSSQEDIYCIRNGDAQLAETLREAQRNTNEVVLQYDGDRGFEFGNCGSKDRIRSVEVR